MLYSFPSTLRRHHLLFRNFFGLIDVSQIHPIPCNQRCQYEQRGAIQNDRLRLQSRYLRLSGQGRTPSSLRIGSSLCLLIRRSFILLQFNVERSFETEVFEHSQDRSEVDFPLSNGEMKIEFQVIVADMGAHDLVRKGFDEGLGPSREKARMGHVQGQSRNTSWEER